jgi:lycopene cyclase-like protein
MPGPGFLADNPYLAGEALFLPTLLVLWLAAGQQRQMMLLAGAMAVALCLPLGAPFAEAVWNPRHLAGSRLGMEDLIYSFAFGASSWGLATIAFRNDYAAHASTAKFLRRSALVTAAGLASFGVVLLSGWDAAGATIVSVGAVAGWVLLRKPFLRRLALCGGIGFGLLFYFELLVWLALWPQTRDWWLPGTMWDAEFLGVPVGEPAWAFLIGAAHPALMGFACDVRRVSSNRAPSRQPPSGGSVLKV